MIIFFFVPYAQSQRLEFFLIRCCFNGRVRCLARVTNSLKMTLRPPVGLQVIGEIGAGG